MLQLIYLIAVKKKKRPSILKSNSTSGDSRQADLKYGVTF